MLDALALPERPWLGRVRDADRTPLRQSARRLVRMAGQVLLAWLGGLVMAPRLDAAARRATVRRSAVRTLRALDVELRVRGTAPVAGGGVLLVANHVSWLDVYALATLDGGRFVAKSEVRDWPLVGAMAARFGTFFLVRRSLRDVARVKDAVAAALRAGDRVVVFPEGTTTDGSTLRRFHAAFLQAAIDAGAVVQTVAVRYRDGRGAPTDAAAFVDDMTFGASLGRLVRAPATVAELTIGPPIAAADASRRALAEDAERFVAAALDVPPPPPRRTALRARAA